AGSFLRNIANVNGTLYFSANSVLWTSGGTGATTMPLKDFGSNSIGSSTNLNGTIYFVVSSTGLWKTDGTLAGTLLVNDLPLTLDNHFFNGIGQLSNVNGTVIFTELDANGAEVWRSDGTAAGTGPMSAVLPDLGASSPAGLTPVNGQLLFAANDGTHGVE